MKKYIALTMGLLLSLGMLVGCGEENSKQPTTESGTIEQAEREFRDTYYMLATTPFEMDTEKMVSYLVEDYETNASNATMETEELNDIGLPADTRYKYALSIGENYYEWELSKIDDSFFVWATKLTSEPDYHSGVPVEDSAAADTLTETLLAEAGIEAALLSKEEYPLASGDGNQLGYRFEQTYEGVPISEGLFDIGAQTVWGPYLTIDIDGSGYRSVAFHNLVMVGEVLKTYHSSEFLAVAELEKRAIAYNMSFMSNVGVDKMPQVQTEIKDIEIVYISSLEKNQAVLVPAYRIIMEEIWDGGAGMSGEYRYIMDVFTGYVYERMMISE